MEIKIENEIVYLGKKEIGTVREFCCGIDFRPKHRKKALFTIMQVPKRLQCNELLNDCIFEIMKLDIPKNMRIHWNFSSKLLYNNESIDSYKKSLKNLRKIKGEMKQKGLI